MKRAIVAVVLAAGCVVVATSCGGAQTKSKVQLAAITSGCKVALDIARDGGEGGATNEIADGCRASLHVWESSK